MASIYDTKKTDVDKFIEGQESKVKYPKIKIKKDKIEKAGRNILSVFRLKKRR